jgi:rare lipoprotein A
MFAVTAAHKTLPLPTYVRVTNLDNGRTLVVRVNDRGPFHDGRIIDLSYAAAVKLGVAATGTARVEVRALDPGRADLGTLIAAPPPRRAPRSAGGEASGPAPRALAPPARAPRSSGRPVYLQVGSFADRDNARRLEDRLEDADVDDVFLDRARVGGRTVHRVRIGPFERLADAQALVARLRGLGYSGVITAAE